MKKLFSMAALVAAMFAIGTTANAQATTEAPKCKTEQCTAKQGVCPEKKMVCNGDRKPGECRVFDNLNLTDKQKSQLQEIQGRDYNKTARELRLKDIKSVLTDAQYVQFLENYFVNSPARFKDGKGPKGPKGQKGFKGGKKFMKGQKDCKKADCKKECKKSDCKK